MSPIRKQNLKNFFASWALMIVIVFALNIVLSRVILYDEAVAIQIAIMMTFVESVTMCPSLAYMTYKRVFDK